MTLQEVCKHIQPLDAQAMEMARRHWSRVGKPLGALGALEDLLVQVAGITGKEHISLEKKAVVVFCADNGVVAEGVTQCGQEITAQVAESLAAGRSSVCRMADVAGAEVFPVDIGMASKRDVLGLLQRNIRRGTANFTQGSAMTREEAEAAVLVGVEMVRELQAAGYDLLAGGEMGIGNTTTSAAVVSVLLDLPAEEVTGRGAGLSDAGLRRKIGAIERGIACNQPRPEDPLEVLAHVGGLDLAGLVGLYLGGALYRVPVILDGFISYAAALLAARLCPMVQGYLLPSHCSDEPASRRVLAELELCPVLQAGMRLGEGTGAVALMPLLEMALAVYRDSATFDDLHMEAYTPQGGETSPCST